VAELPKKAGQKLAQALRDKVSGLRGTRESNNSRSYYRGKRSLPSVRSLSWAGNDVERKSSEGRRRCLEIIKGISSETRRRG